MTTKHSTIDDYLESLDDEIQEKLKSLHDLIISIQPSYEPSMKYGMPTYLYKDKSIAFKKQKHYISLYLPNYNLVEKYSKELNVISAGKSCLRFSKTSDINLKKIETLLKEL